MIIFIDPGHGGNDPGAVGPTNLMEKNVTLSIATSVKEILKKYSIDARLTRNDDSRVELSERVRMANNSNADYFVSIHINSANNPKATGTETYAYPYSVKGIELSKAIQNSLVDEIKLADRGVKTANFYVLRETSMPSTLVEVAFINNPEEEKLLKDINFLNRAATGIARGILEFVGVSYNENTVESNISDWAREAMAWATSEAVGLTDGTAAKEPVTLERMITILYRYNNIKNR